MLRRRGCIRERLTSWAPPSEWPIPIIGVGMRKWLIMCRRSRVPSIQEAGGC